MFLYPAALQSVVASETLSNSEKGTTVTDPSAPRILIYTTPTRPDCHALKRWLAEPGIAYEERDLTDPQIAEEARARTGVRVAPISIVGSEIFYGTFQSQKLGLTRALRPTQGL